MSSVLADVRYGLRMLRKNFGVSAIIVVSIGLGIGVNITIFSLLNAIALRPLPGTKNPAQLVELYTNYKGGIRFGAVSYPDYKDWSNRTQAFSGILAQDLVAANLSKGDRNEIVSAALVSGNFFSVLGVSPERGRFFLPEEGDDTPNSHPVAVISHGLWQRYYGLDPDVVNKSITINARTFTVVGVAPKEFAGANVGLVVDLWVPISMQPVLVPGNDRLKARGMHWLDVMGRLKPGVSIGVARSSIASIAEQLGGEFPDTNRYAGVTVIPTGQGPSDVQSVLLPVVQLLMAVVIFILLIACSNVANLLLSRGTSRQSEVAIRLAMGASRGSIVRMLLTESILLSVVAGVFALLLSYGSMLLLESFKPPTSVPLFLGLQVDGRVMLFALGISLLAGVLFGLIPALRAAQPDLLTTLRSEGFFKMFRKSKLQNALVVLQIALSLFLLVGAGLILRSVQFVQKVDPGFSVDNMILASVDVGLSGYDPARGANLYKQIVERVQSMPGVQAASLAQDAPMEIETTHQIGLFVEGYEAPNQRSISMDFNTVAPGYFHTMNIPFVSGRDFSQQDSADAPAVAIVNEAFAKRYWPGQDPIGKQISNQSAQGPYMQVVGVVKNSKYYNITEKPFPFLYLPFTQRYRPGMVLHIRTAADPSTYVSSIEREVQLLDRALPVYRVHTMKEQLGLSLIELRGAALFLEIFGVMALVLAAVGLYGLMAYSVEKRRPEIAVRMAVGAGGRDVLKLIMKEGLILTGVGIVIGLIAAVASGRVLSSLLYGVSAADPITISLASLFLIVVSLMASLIPAWKAMRTDPMDVLRSS